ncbi:hypothetical protein BZL30_1977 [Mycobacterium kansasii]|uniref:Uncharacterized protein n=1 Tax=Mycobacterium kansasii TaxID=1768 RepID=A0A1V3XIL7_MYCKA|nr:hypothetical protein BZL30_1977 [Mycobacterium kansasii]
MPALSNATLHRVSDGGVVNIQLNERGRYAYTFTGHQSRS